MVTVATMRVSVLRKAGDIGIEERAIPAPGRDEVLIEVGSVGVCGSDVHYYEHGRIGPYVVDAPLVLGHEAGGVIVEVGRDVTHEEQAAPAEAEETVEETTEQTTEQTIEETTS